MPSVQMIFSLKCLMRHDDEAGVFIQAPGYQF